MTLKIYRKIIAAGLVIFTITQVYSAEKKAESDAENTEITAGSGSTSNKTDAVKESRTSSEENKEKLTKEELILKNGSIDDIKKQFFKSSSYYRKKINSQKETILMGALKFDRNSDIVSMILKGGTSLSVRAKNKRDALSYALEYSTKKDVINLILEKSGNAKAIEKKLTSKDKAGKLYYTYSLKNPVSLEIVKNYISNKKEDSENQKKTNDSIKADKTTEKTDEKSAEETEAKTETSDIPEKKTDAENKAAENETTAPLPEPEKIQEPVISIPPAPVTASKLQSSEPVFLYDFAPPETLTLTETDDSQKIIKIDNPDESDSAGRTALMNAAKTGNLWLLKSLINSGAAVNLKDNEGWTALMYGVRYQNNMEVIDLLVQNGAVLKDKNDFGTSILSMAACYSENPEILKKVLNAYKPGDQEIFKSFILCITSESTSILTQCEKLDIFIKRNIPINRINEGRTPLMYAAQFGKSTKIIGKLLSSGAITTIRTSDNRTAFDFASKNTNLAHDEIYWSLNTGR